MEKGHATTRYAINLLGKMAKDTYSVDVQVKLKSPDHHIGIVFLLDHEDQLIDNEKISFSNINLKLRRK